MNSTYLESFARAVMAAPSGKTWRIELPSEVPEQFVIDLIAFINIKVKRDDGSPEALAVLDGDVYDPSLGHLESEFELVNYRCDQIGERRFMVLRGPSRVESITNATIPLLTGGFPKHTSQDLTIRDIAEEAVTTLAGKIGTMTNLDDLELAIDRLEECFKILSHIHEATAATSMRPWNMEWMTFVDQALERVPDVFLTCNLTKLAEAIFPAFGLPKPNKNETSILGSAPAAAKLLLKAHADWWSTEQEIEKSLGFLRSRVANSMESNRDLLQFSADFYQRGFELAGHTIANFLTTISVSLIDAAKTDEYPPSDFLSPRSLSKAKGITRIQVASGEPLGIKSSVPESAPYLIPLKNSGDNDVRSNDLVVVLRYKDGAKMRPIESVGFAFELSRADCFWETIGVEHTLEGLAITGYVHAHKPMLDKLDAELAVVGQLTYDLNPKDPLAEDIEPAGKARVVLCNDFTDDEYLLTFNSKSTSPTFENSRFLTNPTSQGIDAEIQSLGLLVRAGSASCEGVPLAEIAETGFFIGTVSVAEHIEISNGQSIITVFRESQKRVIHSPIIAAITKEILSVSEPSPANSDSIRGSLETLLTENLTDSSWLRSNFHIAIGEDIPLGSSAGMNTDYPNGFVCSREVGSILQNIGVEVSEEFLSRPEVRNFQESVTELGLENAIISRLDGSPTWPSRTSWRHLAKDKSKINRLLVCYEEMVLAARSDFGPYEEFWASYPFSASFWDIDKGTCSGLLLSPLHPIRLAWLSSVEDGLWASPDAEKLSGVIEGWNFPTLGPAPIRGASMLAIPTDHGEDSLFLGWSMMVPVHSQAQGVGGPSLIGGYTAPGNSSTGLNASASISAIKSYRKVNPQFSSLTLDLAVSAGKSSPRLTELDEAIMAMAESISEDGDALPGGLHVLDSLSRVGRFPRELIEESASTLSPRPFTWRRYKTNAKGSQACNVRLLQDPGIQIRLGQGEIDAAGVVAETPFRRFSPTLSALSLSKGETAFSIGLRSDSAWMEFRNAVEVVESGAYGRHLFSNLNKPAIADSSADWTVSGEGLLSPSSVSSLLSSVAGGDQMLWEWKPPFFDKTALIPEVSRRAYMTIARIPNSFKLQLSQRLHGLGMDNTRVAATSRRILETLGARGMGLSGLLAMGGTHTAGAVGFFGSYELLSKLEDDGNLLVLPIDACDGFLRNLTDTDADLSKRKADLLGLIISEDGLQLVPIEVKMYKLGSKEKIVLPAPESSDLDEAVDQVLATKAILSEVASTYERLSSRLSGDQYRQLWMTNLATLVETARKLSPRQPRLDAAVPNLLNRLMTGEANVQVGTPMIHYFMGDGATTSGEKFQAKEILSKASLERLHVVVANIQTLFEDKSRVALQEAMKSLRNDAPAGRAPAVPTAEASSSTGDSDAEVTGTKKPNNSGGEGTSSTSPQPQPWLDSGRPGLTSLVGKESDGKLAVFWPSDRSTLPHFGVIGASGSGKTQLMKRVLYDLSQSSQAPWDNPGILILDYKGDFSFGQDDGFRSLGGFATSTALSLRLNYWQVSEVEKARFNGNLSQAIAAKASSFKSMLERIQPQIGAVQGSNLTEAIKEAFIKAQGSGLAFPPISLINLLYKQRAKKADVVTALFDNILTIELFAETAEDAVDLDQFFARGQKKIIDFSALSAYGDPALEKLAVSVVLDALVQNMFNSYTNIGVYDDKLGTQQINQFVFVDEAHNLIPLDLTAIDKLLSQGRSFGHGLMMATQSMQEFRVTARDYRGLIPTWCVLQNNNPQLQDSNALGIPNDQHPKWRNEINEFTPGQALFRRAEDSQGSKELKLTKIQTSTFLEIIER